MATAEDWAKLRNMLSEPDDSNGWTDTRLDELLIFYANSDGSLDFDAAASGGWREKAAGLTSLVNISENGSSRSMSQEFEHAMKMASLFGSAVDKESPLDSPARPRSKRIVRPSRDG